MTLSSCSGLAYDEEESVSEGVAIPDYASQTYESVKRAGLPAHPLDFPTPKVNRAAFIHSTAMDHRQGRVYSVNMLANSTGKAYLVKKTISKTVYGCIKLCVVLRRRCHKFDCGGIAEAEYISTDELIALKASSWSKIRQIRGRHLKDPLKEAACLQLVGNYHENVLGCLEVLQDDNYLYTVMPYCSGGDLYSVLRNQNRTLPDTSTISSHSHSSSSHSSDSHQQQHVPDETQARLWFRQLLAALLHFQKKGVVHRHLSLENILIEDNNNLVIIDFGLALRVPYVDPSNYGGVSDVSEGTSRLLIKAQGQSGTLNCLAPEIIERNEAFDGFATDLWSCGVLLFIFLVGRAPFKWPNSTDFCYSQINRGKLKQLMASNLSDRAVSDEACDLLQNMLWRDPRKRLTLAQVLQHPWVVVGEGDASPPPPIPPQSNGMKHSSTTSSFEKPRDTKVISPIQPPRTVTTARLKF